ncbi:MAG: hypothetical protein ABI672_00740 [Vicinamibacteria bacterium]
MRALKVVGAIVVLLVIGVACFFIAKSLMPGPPRVSARESLLIKQNEELAKLADAAEKGTLLDFKNVMIVVDQVLVQDLLRAVTPMQADVGKGFHLVINSADAAFGDGVALVRLTGNANVGGTSVGSEVTVYGAIDVVRLDPVSGVLQCSINVLGVEAVNAAALGRGDPVGRLTEALTHGGLALLLGGLEIPVSIEDKLSIPAVESKRLQIKAENLPLTVAAEQIKVFAGKLWVFVDVALAPRAVALQKPAVQTLPTPSPVVPAAQVKS